jgi:hypothetical protein
VAAVGGATKSSAARRAASWGAATRAVSARSARTGSSSVHALVRTSRSTFPCGHLQKVEIQTRSHFRELLKCRPPVTVAGRLQGSHQPRTTRFEADHTTRHRGSAAAVNACAC